MSENFGEALTLPLLRARVKLLALIDVKKKAGRLGLVEFLAAALGGIDQVAQRGLASVQGLHPAVLACHPLGVGCRELPGVKERFHQRLERMRGRVERK